MKLNENQKVTLTIGQLKRLVKESKSKRRVNEEYDPEAYEYVYIGRTDAYYDEEEDHSPSEWWTWSEEPDDPDFAVEGPIYELNEDGKRDFFEWLDAEQVGYDLNMGRMTDWPSRHRSSEDEWEYLTDPKNELSNLS